MRGHWNILAESDFGSLVNLLVVAVMAIVAVIGKLAEKRLKESAARKAEEDRQRRAARGGLSLPPRPAEQPTPARDLPPVTNAAQRDQLRRNRLAQYRRGIQQQLQQMMPPINVRDMLVTEEEPELQAEPEAVEIEPEEFVAPVPPPVRRRPVPRPVAQPAARRVAEPMVVGGGVDKEMAALQERDRKLQQMREQRLSARAIPEADTAAIESHLLRIRPNIATSEELRHVSLVNLSDPAQARAAIIFHEILAPPKALRSDREMWDE